MDVVTGYEHLTAGTRYWAKLACSPQAQACAASGSKATGGSSSSKYQAAVYSACLTPLDQLQASAGIGRDCHCQVRHSIAADAFWESGAPLNPAVTCRLATHHCCTRPAMSRQPNLCAPWSFKPAADMLTCIESNVVHAGGLLSGS